MNSQKYVIDNVVCCIGSLLSHQIIVYCKRASKNSGQDCKLIVEINFLQISR